MVNIFGEEYSNKESEKEKERTRRKSSRRRRNEMGNGIL